LITADINKQAQYWATSKAFDDKTRKEIQHLIDENAAKELTDRFYTNLEFGTGGLRGILGAGTSRMNRYNVQKATTALSRYLQHTFKGENIAVAISYDSRNFSREFAEVTASTLAACGIRAILTKELRPVPMLSFMVRKYQCHAGVCVTASHNPPAYNGYKVYWATGGQVVPPHDSKIIDIYNSIESYDDLPGMKFEEALKSGLVHEVGAELDDDYLDRVSKLTLNKGGREGFKIVYSALHGTGAFPVMESLKRFGFKEIYTVEAQMKPDGNFPTVKSPNPEDRSALKMAIDLAKEKQADIVLATDPDCDRLGVAVRDKDDYLCLNGNQIGSLLIDYILGSKKRNGTLPPNALVIKTIVTTEQQHDIATYYGASCEDTLTGFKWICERIEQYETKARTPYRQFLCGGEESYGFLADTFVRDKDGVIACSLAAEMVAYYKSQGLSLTAVLDNLYKRHGVYLEDLYNVTLPGKEGAQIIQEKMKKLRQDPPLTINGIQVKKLLDFQSSQTRIQQGSKFVAGESIDLPKSNVLQFILEDGTRVTARPSGTEPKIKFYFSVYGKVPENVSSEQLEAIKSNVKTKLGEYTAAFTAMMT
jgi:phosphoglucomutase